VIEDLAQRDGCAASLADHPAWLVEQFVMAKVLELARRRSSALAGTQLSCVPLCLRRCVRAKVRRRLQYPLEFPSPLVRFFHGLSCLTSFRKSP